MRRALGPPHDRVVVGPGDDAALVHARAYAVTSIDTMVDGVHFRLGQASPRDIGHRALAGALSDLAAMAADPGEAYVSLTLPQGFSTGDAEALATGMAELARRTGTAQTGVHVKLDSGMGRLGTRDPEEATRVAEAVVAAPGLRLAGAMTHFATADEEDRSFLEQQLRTFEPWARALAARHPELLVHAANSAATLAAPAARFDLVRCGIAIYGMDPFHRDPAAHGLAPALELCSYVAEVKRCRAGESAGYGRRFVAERDTWLGVLPIGYGDGVRRALTNNADVIVEGRRVPLVGTVSMDNVTIDLGPDEPVAPGTEAVLIGEGIHAEEVARRLGTINYEVTCAITARVPRRYHRDGAPA